MVKSKDNHMECEIKWNAGDGISFTAKNWIRTFNSFRYGKHVNGATLSLPMEAFAGRLH